MSLHLGQSVRAELTCETPSHQRRLTFGEPHLRLWRGGSECEGRVPGRARLGQGVCLSRMHSGVESRGHGAWTEGLIEALCGADLVTLRSKCRASETIELHRVEGGEGPSKEGLIAI